MSGLDRRSFFKFAALSGAAALTARPRTAEAAKRAKPPEEQVAILVDTTRCAGCRGCEAACAESNGLPEPVKLADPTVFDKRRFTQPDSFSVVNRFQPKGQEEVFVKTQCMHCVSPACASACLVKALEKTPEGPVVYHSERCIGCRYCMVACPFEVPRFDFNSPAPFIRKCQMCAHRQREGKPPACAEVCPTEAIQFGKRGELLEQARARIYNDPGRYVHHIYGEREAGGTDVLYLAGVPFEELGFPSESAIGQTPIPARTAGFTSMVPFVLSLWPPLLVGLHAITSRRGEGGESEDPESTGDGSTTDGDVR